MYDNPLKRALRNGLLLSLVVAGLSYYQELDAALKLTTAAVAGFYSFIIITPALWLSYRWTAKMVQKYSQTSTVVQDEQVEHNAQNQPKDEQPKDKHNDEHAHSKTNPPS
jgi:ABC-type nickel/cobalt efflux system permease component RcnA